MMALRSISARIPFNRAVRSFASAQNLTPPPPPPSTQSKPTQQPNSATTSSTSVSKSVLRPAAPPLLPELRSIDDINAELQFVTSLTTAEKDELVSKYEHTLASAEQRLAILNSSIVPKPPNSWGLTPRAKLKYMTKKYAATWYVYFWATWLAHGAVIWTGIKSGVIDAPMVIDWGSDVATSVGQSMNAGWGNVDLASRVDPKMGEMGVTIVLNEMIEPIRSAFVIATVKPVSKMVGMSPKYDFMDSEN